jgi:hypothetical protein
MTRRRITAQTGLPEAAWRMLSQAADDSYHFNPELDKAGIKMIKRMDTSPEATARWQQRKLLAAKANPLTKPRMGRRDRALGALVVQTIRQTMPPVLLHWCPRLQLLLRDHHLHLQPVAIALTEDHLTPGAHRHEPSRDSTTRLMANWIPTEWLP